MKLAFQLAYKNLMGAGLRTWLNVAILSFAFLLILFINGLLDGWNAVAVRDTIQWEIGHGHLLHEDFDPYDPFTLQDGHGPLPQNMDGLMPILMQQASLFPEGRLVPVTLKGIPVDQTSLRLPTTAIMDSDADIPVLIGQRMARDNQLAEGDEILLRWRDKDGTFDARPVTIAKVFEADLPSVDNGQLWLSLDQLYTMTGLADEATLMVADRRFRGTREGWTWKSQENLLQNVNDLIATKKASSSIMYLLLLGLALLAIFDTQVLSVFRRQREIGTYVALGMTRAEVVGLFTVEGSMYSLFSIVVASTIGIPLFVWLAGTGIAIPTASREMGVAIAERIFPVFGVGLLIGTVLLVVISATIVSFLPARRIARLDPVEALKGRIQ